MRTTLYPQRCSRLRVARRLPWAALALVTLLLWPVAAHAFPPGKPYDPRPLMAELEKRTGADRFTFAVMGDIQGSSAFAGVAARVEALKPDFVLLTGDQVQRGNPGNYDLFEKQFGAWMRKVPSWPCMGNHDSHGQGTAAFLKFYGLPSTRYSFDFRNARFVCLQAFYHTNLDRADLDWLEKQLAEGKQAGKHLFVCQHCPVYTVGSRKADAIPGKPNDFVRLLAKYGAVADFSGHEHMYYRTRREGVYFFVGGLAGAGVYSLGRTAEALPDDVYYGAEGGGFRLHTPAGDKAMKKIFMVNTITVDGGKITGRMVTTDGEIVDEYVLREGQPQGEAK